MRVKAIIGTKTKLDVEVHATRFAVRFLRREHEAGHVFADSRQLNTARCWPVRGLRRPRTASTIFRQPPFRRSALLVPVMSACRLPLGS